MDQSCDLLFVFQLKKITVNHNSNTMDIQSFRNKKVKYFVGLLTKDILENVIFPFIKVDEGNRGGRAG